MLELSWSNVGLVWLALCIVLCLAPCNWHAHILRHALGMHVKGNRHTRDKHILSLSLQLSKILGRVVRGLIESSKPFVRWMDGTCIEAPEQRSAQVGIMFSHVFY